MTTADELPHLIEIHDHGECDTQTCHGYSIGHLLTCPERLSDCPYQKAPIEGAASLPPGRYELHLDASRGVAVAADSEYQPPETIRLPTGWTLLTDKTPVRADRARDWARYARPLPGADVSRFFREAVDGGFISESEAAEYKERHERLCREEAKTNGAFQCNTCNGAPPAGFTCQNCGGGSQ